MNSTEITEKTGSKNDKKPAKKGFQVVNTSVNFLLYSLYITIVCIITFGYLTPGTYYITKVIYDQLIDASFEGYGEAMTTFRTSSTINDFWAFTETAMLDGIFLKKWHYNHDPSIKEPIPSHKTGQMYDNRLIGRARLRQIRMVRDTCPVFSVLPLLARTCYPKYDESKEEKQPFYKRCEDDSCKYHSEEMLKGTSFWGSLDKYSGGGAFVLLETNAQDTKIKTLFPLKNNLWITRATRAVFLEFTFFNPNLDVFSTVRLAWEIPATGGVTTSWDIQTIKLVQYSTPYEKFILVCEIAFICLTVFYVVQEFIYLFMMGCKKYFRSVWTYVNIIIFLLSAYCIEYSVQCYFTVNKAVEHMTMETNEFIDFQTLAFWENLYNDLSGILIFLVWIKLFKYLSFNRSMSQLSETLARCATDIGGFGVIFLIVVFAFAQLGYAIFGRQVFAFSTLGQSIFTLIQFILGEFDYREVEKANRLLGPTFFFAYIVFVFMILLNMFLAIINDSYHAVQNIKVKDEDKIETKDCIVACCCKNISKYDELIPASDVRDICMEPSEIKSYLKKKGYSNVEIEIFFARFDVDENDTLDADEGHKFLSDLKNNYYRAKITSHNYRKNKNNKTLQNCNSPESNKLAKAELQELISRLGIIESAAVEVLPKISDVWTQIELKLDRKRKFSIINDRPEHEDLI